ncbi:MAG: PKD domain-containing protein, partial [Marinilabiliaceae bacterium]
MKTNESFKIALAALFFISLNACEDDENTTDDLQHGLSADAGTSQTVEVGETVELDASQSEDANEEGFEIEWSFVSLPDDSEVDLSSTDSEKASFTPDKPGEYVALLTISNELGESEDEVTITVNEAAAETQTLSGSYDENLQLENIHDDPGQADYLVTGNVQINAELTIDPGVRIELEEDVLFDISEDGVMKAIGTSSDGIVFTSADKDGDKFWKGLRVKSTDGQNRLENVVIEYAGNSEMDIGRFNSNNRQTNVGIDNDGVLSIVNTEISNSKGYGLVARGTVDEHASNNYDNNGEAGIYTHISNTESIDEESLFTTNDYNGVEIYGSTLEQKMTWAKLNGDLSYKVSGDIEIDAELSISEGVNIELTEDVFVDVTTEGIIMATGTEDSNVTFTTASPESGKYWKGLRIKSTDIRNSFDHVTSENGGNSEMNIGPYSGQNRQTIVGIDDDAKINITNSEFSNSRGYGLVARGVILEHETNSYTDNNESAVYTQVLNAGIFDEASSFSGNSQDGPQIYGSTLLEEITWSKLEDGASYKISNDLEIEAPLFITEGTLIEVDEDVLISIDEGSDGSTLDGYIDIAGTESNPVVFTTSNLAGGQYWKGLRVSTSDARNNIENAVIEYAGNSEMNIGPYSGQNRQTIVGI